MSKGVHSPTRPGLLALMGNTPLVPITRLNPNPRVEVYGKLESQNPGGSVKDRIALAMIEEGERQGLLHPGKTILEATSGNTGIGLATVAAVKGYSILLAMSEGVSLERRKILAALGAEFLLTPADLGTDGAIEVVYDLSAREPDKYYLTDQYNNPANVRAHEGGTAQEIWAQTQGRVTHFVATMGTTGTLMGTSKGLRAHNPGIVILGVEPYLGHRIQGLKNMKEAYIPGIYDRSLLTEKVNVEDDAAYDMARCLAREEGLLVGMSAGAAMSVALERVKGLDSGVVVVLLPDGGERYLSTPLFQVAEDVEPEVNLHFLNSLTRRREVFTPQSPKEATMYCCGPTVQAVPHIGLYRRLLVADLVARTLEMAGYPVRQVVNITDLDDKTIDEADRLGSPLKEVTEAHIREFLEDVDSLRIKRASAYPRTSEHIDDMLDLTRTLVKEGYAYEKLKSVYFDIRRFSGYGHLSGVDLDKIRLGATVDLDSYEKDDPRDFTLLKRSTLGEIKKGISYKTEWGNVRPSWHIQCAAMALKHLGDTMDIHLGGADLLFPHHENEIAVCQAATGQPPARFWLHSGMVMVDRKKMSRSSKNIISLRDLSLQGYTGRQVRFYFLSTQYRQPLQFSCRSLESACGSLKRYDELVRNLRWVRGGEEHGDVQVVAAEFQKAFQDALFDDLNVASALAALFHLVRRVNRRLARGQVGEADARTILDALSWADQVLAILPEEAPAQDGQVEILVREREEARQRQDFERADAIRQRLEGQGITIKDTPQGPQWYHRPDEEPSP